MHKKTTVIEGNIQELLNNIKEDDIIEFELCLDKINS
jgi:hypothetical protein